MKARVPTVAILMESIPAYREPFYELLRAELGKSGIRLLVVQGRPSLRDQHEFGRTIVPDARVIDNRHLPLGPWRLVWQPALRHLREADLVVVEQASRLLLNYLLITGQVVGRRRVALWGHGRNLQLSKAHPLGERLKRNFSRRAHWWFAYNETSAAIVRALGFPASRITNVQNAIDTTALRRALEGVGRRRQMDLRRKLGLSGDSTAVYVGRMHAEKRLGFLLEACRLVRAKQPDFEVIFIGAGPDAGIVQAAAAGQAWIHYVGPLHGEDKVLHCSLAKVMLLPSAVGLAVLDACALELPMIACAGLEHGPEVEYLQHDVNGLIVDGDNPQAYADAVADVLSDPSRLDRLREGCRRAAQRYTVEEMAARFGEGLRAALAAPTRPRWPARVAARSGGRA